MFDVGLVLPDCNISILQQVHHSVFSDSTLPHKANSLSTLRPSTRLESDHDSVVTLRSRTVQCITILLCSTMSLPDTGRKDSIMRRDDWKRHSRIEFLSVINIRHYSMKSVIIN